MKDKIQARDGYWYKVRQFESCCDCGLCHQKEWKILLPKKKGDEYTLYFRAWRDTKRTKDNRKNKLTKKIT